MSQNRVQPGVPEGGQFAATNRDDADPSVHLDADDQPVALADLEYDNVDEHVITDADTGDSTFYHIAVTKTEDGYVARGELPIDLAGYAEWRRDVADPTEWVEGNHETLDAAIKAGWGKNLVVGYSGEYSMEVPVPLDEDEDDSSTITTRLHEAFPEAGEVSEGSQTAAQREAFFTKLHQHVTAQGK